jgi:arsenate reductase
MHEIGIAMPRQRTRGVSEHVGRSFHFVITLCDRPREACPTWPGAAAEICWSMADPLASGATDEQRAKACRRMRDDLRQRIQLFMLSNRIGSERRRGSSSSGDFEQ